MQLPGSNTGLRELSKPALNCGTEDPSRRSSSSLRAIIPASGGRRSWPSLLDLRDALPGSRHTLLELRGLPVESTSFPGALVHFTALRRLELIYPLHCELGLPAGLRSLHVDNVDDFKVRLRQPRRRRHA